MTYTIPEALEVEPKLKALCESDPRYERALEQAQKLEGLTRHAGMHAAGVVISEGPLWDHVPCLPRTASSVRHAVLQGRRRARRASSSSTSSGSRPSRSSTSRCASSTRARPQPRRSRLRHRDDPARRQGDLRAPQSGETTGVFQLESSGMQQLFKDLQARLLRGHRRRRGALPPGPARHGHGEGLRRLQARRKPIEKMHPLVDELSEPTYGVIVYQEQVMQIAQRSPATRSAAPTSCAAPWARRSPRRWPSRRPRSSTARRRTACRSRRRAHLRPARVLRGLRLQQEPLGGVRAHHLPDGLPQGALPGRVPLRADDGRPRQDRQGRAHHRRGARVGRDGAAPRRSTRATSTSRSSTRRRGHERPRVRRASAMKDHARPKIRFGLGAVRGV
jgi:hypothetical protein